MHPPIDLFDEFIRAHTVVDTFDTLLCNAF
jgi:hypothetical protein